MEALRLYEPLPFQEAYHTSRYRETILMKATRAGGSLAGFVEDARAALGCDPHDKYPKRDGIIVCVGYGEGHIGRVIHKFLFRPGAFTIIKDEETGEYRTFRPWARDKEFEGKYGDAGRESESEPAPPLIPARRLASKIAWARRSHYVFSRADLDTGWVIYAANSAGDPNQFQGFNVNLYHIDEDIEHPGWYREATSRTQMVEGLLRWTAMPHQRNQELAELVRRAKEQEGEPGQISKLLEATMYDNPYMPQKAKEENARIWMSMGEDVYKQRALGQLVNDSVRMYPTFGTRIHDYNVQSGAVANILKERNGQVPEGWCRYMVVDPGHAVCAVAFFAVPPESLGDHVYLYDELYIKQASAKMFGDGVKEKAQDFPFQSFIIDAHGGRLTDFGSGIQPREQYSEELRQRQVGSVETGYNFISGSDVVAGRETALRSWLQIRPDGTTKLLVNSQACPNYCREMEGFMKKFVDQGGVRVVVDEGNRRHATHLVECFSADTEVLTKCGWKFWPDVVETDELATASPRDGKLEYQKPNRLVSRSHAGEMVHFSGKSQGWLVTPNHRMIYRGQSEARDGSEDYQVSTASEINKGWELLVCPSGWDGASADVVTVDKCVSRQGRVVSLQKELDPCDWAEFLGWFVAEGCVTPPRCPGHGYRVLIAQTKQPHRTILEMLLSRLPWKFLTIDSGFQASSKQLWEYLGSLGRSSWEKQVPQWIMDAEQRVIQAFLRGFLLGDGWVQGGLSRSGVTSPKLADQIQELFLKCGRSVNIGVRLDQIGKTRITANGREITSRRPIYSLRELSRHTRGLRRSDGAPTFSAVDYDGDVYCATVPNSTLIVRRYGVPLVAGNCSEYAAAHGLKFVKPPKSLVRKTWADSMIEETMQRRRNRLAAQGGAGITLGPQGVRS